MVGPTIGWADNAARTSGFQDARMRSEFAVFAIVLNAALAACSAEQWGLPRVPLQVFSPDGRYVAFVKNHPNIDPYDQSLWLRPAEGSPVRLARVPPDAWWCDRIVWSADSRRVGFVVSDAIVHVYDATTRARVFSGFVGRRSWDTPPKYILRDVSLGDDGTSVSFRECERTWVPVEPALQNRRGTRVRQVINGCSGALSTVVLATVPGDKRWPAE